MPLVNQLFTNIVSGVAPINPGIGGWDALINQFMSDRRGRHGFGLLARMLDVSPDTDTEGTTLVTIPAGWAAMAIFVMVGFAGLSPTATYRFLVGSDEADWNNSGVALFTQLTSAKEMLIVWPYPNASPFDPTSPSDIPIIDGDDDPGRSTFRVRRIGGASRPLHFWVYGATWQTSD